VSWDEWLADSCSEVRHEVSVLFREASLFIFFFSLYSSSLHFLSFFFSLSIQNRKPFVCINLSILTQLCVYMSTGNNSAYTTWGRSVCGCMCVCVYVFVCVCVCVCLCVPVHKQGRHK